MCLACSKWCLVFVCCCCCCCYYSDDDDDDNGYTVPLTVNTDQSPEVVSRGKSAFTLLWFPNDLYLLELNYPVKALQTN